MSKTAEADGYVSWDSVRDGLKESTSPGDESSKSEEGGASSVVVVCFTQAYNPASLFQRDTLRELTGDGSLSYCTVHFVDVDANREALIDVGVSSTPALMVYVAGNPVTIDRPGLEPDTKFVGALSKDNLTHLLRIIQAAGAKGTYSVLYDL